MQTLFAQEIEFKHTHVKAECRVTETSTVRQTLNGYFSVNNENILTI